MSSTVNIKGHAIDLDDPAIQNILQRTYAEKLRPLCGCKTPGVPMYIAKVGNMFYVKRMPDSGANHSVTCTSYDPPPELSGLGEVMGSAIKEDTESGLTALKFDFALTKSAGRAAPAPTGVEHDSVKSDSTKLTIRALLHYLWDGAKLTHWHPSWAGKRNWATVYRHLTQAASGKQAKGGALIDSLYVPAPFYLDKKDEIARQRSALLAPLAQGSASSRKLGIVVGEVKEVAAARYGFKIVFKQVPDFHFMINEDVHRKLLKRFDGELAMWDAFENSHLVAIATFGLGPTGLASIEEIALMLTTENWIPFSDLNERNLIDELTGKGRRFIKSLRYNMSSLRPLAAVELLDTAAPVAMFITPPDASDEYKGALQDLTEASKLGSWVWDVAVGMPPVPAVFVERSAWDETGSA